MKTPLTELIQIDPSLATPVYKQIVQSVCRGIDNGILVKDDVLPSVNKIAETFSLARGSVFSAYNDLRASGIIDSIPGKGYFVARTNTNGNNRVLLLLDVMSDANQVLYTALLHHLPKGATVDVFFHHHNAAVFATILREQAGYYNTFILLPENSAASHSALTRLDARRTLLINNGMAQPQGGQAGVYQNLAANLYTFLMANGPRIARYHRLFLVVPDGPGSSALVAGFNRFSKETGTATAVLHSIGTVKKGDAFIVWDDAHLVALAQHVFKNNWAWGSDIGVLSFTENTLKAAIGAGVSTLSPDAEAMGTALGTMLASGQHNLIENPIRFTNRHSF